MSAMLLTGVFLLFCCGTLSYAFTMPDTGETTCYDASGNVISCVGTGQDGEHIINPMVYTDNGDGTVTDKVTGLMWQKQDPGTAMTWSTAVAYCGSLNLAGHSDWRLPSTTELLSIVNASLSSETAIMTNTTYFQGPLTAASYWTSIVAAWDSASAWYIAFGGGYDGITSQTQTMDARCVRGAPTGEDEFTDNNNGTVTDNVTGLMWQQTGPSSTMTWANALTYCNGLSLAGHADWRLPNAKDLASIFDYNESAPSIDTTFFPDGGGIDWSSTTDSEIGNKAWAVDFYYNGISPFYSKTSANSVRCMRGGQPVLPNFSDVPSTDSYYGYIEAIYNAGITVGCGNGDYCPSESVTRDQMAAFIIRALYGENFTCNGGASCSTETPYFSDVPATNNFFKYIQKMKELGITTGCGNNDYCPSESVTRDQMAAFLVRANQIKSGLAPENFTCTGSGYSLVLNCATMVNPYFSDVPNASADQFYKYIQKLDELKITVGCGNGDYCPFENVTRDQMSAFLARSFLGMQ
jgi:hypothetical protein